MTSQFGPLGGEQPPELYDYVLNEVSSLTKESESALKDKIEMLGQQFFERHGVIKEEMTADLMKKLQALSHHEQSLATRLAATIVFGRADMPKECLEDFPAIKNALNGFPHQEKGEALSLLISCMGRSPNVKSLLKELDKVPTKDRLALLRDVVAYLDGFELKIAPANALAQLLSIPSHVRSEVIRQALRFSSEWGPIDEDLLEQQLEKMQAQGDLSEIESEHIPYFTDTFIHPIQLLHFLAGLDEPARYVDQAIELYRVTAFRDRLGVEIPSKFSTRQQGILREALLYIAPEFRQKVLQKNGLIDFRYVLQGNASSVRMVLEMLLRDDEIKNGSLRYLIDLSKTETDPVLLTKMTKKIVDLAPTYGLSYSDPVFEKIATLYGELVPDTPAHLFLELKRQTAEEPLFDLSLRPSVVDGMSCKWSLDRLRKERKELTFQEIPPFDRDLIDRSFKAIDARLNQLPPSEREKAEKELNRLGDYNSLKSNMLNKPLIPGLLRLAGAPEATASPYLMALANSVRFLESKSEIPKGERFLSERESYLLSFSASVVGCSTGQEDGLIGYSNTLIAAGKIQGKAIEERGTEDVDKALIGSIQTFFSEGLRDEELIKKATDLEEVEEASHYTKYLANRLYRQIGYDHEVSYDPHGTLVDYTLLEAPTEKLATLFFEENPVSKALPSIARDLNQAIQNKTLTFGALYDVLKQQPNKPGNWQDSWFEYDENVVPVGVAEAGAFRLLYARGFVVTA